MFPYWSWISFCPPDVPKEGEPALEFPICASFATRIVETEAYAGTICRSVAMTRAVARTLKIGELALDIRTVGFIVVGCLRTSASLGRFRYNLIECAVPIH